MSKKVAQYLREKEDESRSEISVSSLSTTRSKNSPRNETSGGENQVSDTDVVQFLER